MGKITKEQYELASARVEELLPLVDESTPLTDRNAVELSLMSDIVIEYEKEHYPIEKPTVSELISLALEEMNMTQKELATAIGVSPSRINDYVRTYSQNSAIIMQDFAYFSCSDDGIVETDFICFDLFQSSRLFSEPV